MPALLGDDGIYQPKPATRKIVQLAIETAKRKKEVAAIKANVVARSERFRLLARLRGEQ